MKSLKNFVFAALVVALALAVVGCSHSTGGNGDPLLGNKVIGGTPYAKTGEVVVTAKSVVVHMEDDSAWSGYVESGASDYYKGVFIKDRAVTLSPFAMGKYEVTQELFEKVMDTNPSICKQTETAYKLLEGEKQELRPIENVNWYHAIAFCNKLSILQGLEPCYTVEGVDFKTLTYEEIPTSSNATWDSVTCNFKKKGYRLPTEAEWEYAARGGKNSDTWGYSYAGSQTEKDPSKIASSPYNDNALDEYGWYRFNLAGGASTASSSISNVTAGYGTHEVGTKKANTLGIYDMSGNVWEWCWDWYNYTVDTAAVTDPAGPFSGSSRLKRGGGWDYYAYSCAVSIRDFNLPNYRYYDLGFRLARSL